MPGPEEFRRDIRTVRCFTLAQSLVILLSMCGFVLAIAFAVGGNWREGAVTAGVCLAFAGVLLCLLYRQKRLRRKATQCYTFPLPHAFGYEEVCAAIESRRAFNGGTSAMRTPGSAGSRERFRGGWRCCICRSFLYPTTRSSAPGPTGSSTTPVLQSRRGLCGRSCPEHASTLWCATP